MGSSKAQIGVPLTALILTCILLPALPSPSRAQPDVHDGKYNVEDDSDTVVYEGLAQI